MILSSGRKPERVLTDRGTDFFNKHFQKLMNDENIHFYNTFNETKASIVERSIRTLKTQVWRYFTANITTRYIDMLPDLVYGYNHSINRCIKIKPALVNHDNENRVWHELYDEDLDDVRLVKYRFNIGNQERIGKIKGKSEKGYLPNFSKEIFTVSKRSLQVKGLR